MARISSSSRVLTETFKEVAAASAAAGEKNDCSVKALVIVTGLSYEECHKAMAAHGRQNGKGAYVINILDAARSLGFKVERVWLEGLISQFPGVHKNLKSVTTHHPERFPEAFEGAPPMLMFVTGHVAGFRDGAVHDWTKGRSKRVESMYKVTKVAP